MNMMRVNILHGVLLLAITTLVSVTANGCDVLDASVKGSGDIATENREVTSFTGVVLKGSADITITQGAELKVEVSTDDNILPLITTEVSNGLLIIDSKESYSTSYGVKVNVIVPKLESISVTGSGDIEVTSASVENLPLENFKIDIRGSGDVKVAKLYATTTTVEIEGSGDIELQGSGTTLTVALSGSGDITVDEFIVKNCTATISGSGDIRVYATDSLEARVSGSGDIFYRGNPASLKKSVTGSGDITKID